MERSQERKAASVESQGMGRSALGSPSQQAGPVFQVLPGNLPRGAGGCGWGTSGKDGEAETKARLQGPAPVSTRGSKAPFRRSWV